MILFGLLQEFPMLFWSVKGDFRKEGKREESTWEEEEEAAAVKASTHINKSKDGLCDSIENIWTFVLL